MFCLYMQLHITTLHFLQYILVDWEDDLTLIVKVPQTVQPLFTDKGLNVKAKQCTFPKFCQSSQVNLLKHLPKPHTNSG